MLQRKAFLNPFPYNYAILSFLNSFLHTVFSCDHVTGNIQRADRQKATEKLLRLTAVTHAALPIHSEVSHHCQK